MLENRVIDTLSASLGLNYKPVRYSLITRLVKLAGRRSLKMASLKNLTALIMVIILMVNYSDGRLDRSVRSLRQSGYVYLFHR